MIFGEEIIIANIRGFGISKVLGELGKQGSTFRCLGINDNQQLYIGIRNPEKDVILASVSWAFEYMKQNDLKLINTGINHLQQIYIFVGKEVNDSEGLPDRCYSIS